MLTRSILTPEDLYKMLAHLWVKNKKGSIDRIVLFDGKGEVVNLGWCEIISEEAPIDLDPPQDNMQSQVTGSYERLLARQIIQPLSIEELSNLEARSQ